LVCRLIRTLRGTGRRPRAGPTRFRRSPAAAGRTFRTCSGTRLGHGQRLGSRIYAPIVACGLEWSPIRRDLPTYLKTTASGMRSRGPVPRPDRRQVHRAAAALAQERYQYTAIDDCTRIRVLRAQPPLQPGAVDPLPRRGRWPPCFSGSTRSKSTLNQWAFGSTSSAVAPQAAPQAALSMPSRSCMPILQPSTTVADRPPAESRGIGTRPRQRDPLDALGSDGHQVPNRAIHFSAVAPSTSVINSQESTGVAESLAQDLRRPLRCTPLRF
jgi:hypothetical protein